MRSLTLTAAFALLIGLAPLSLANDSYVRFQPGDTQGDAAMQTAVAHFSNPDSKVEIVLYGVVHIADADFYARVQKDLDSYDVVLFEGVAPGKVKPTEQDKGLGEMQKMMGEMLGLTFQKDGIDYTRSNLVHADMNMDQLKEAMGGQSLNPMGGLMGGQQMKALAPMLKMFSGFAKSMPGMQNRLKMMMGNQMANADISKQMPGKMGEVILIDRNKVVMQYLDKQLQTTKDGTVAIFYGAAHNPDLEERLAKLGWTRTSKRWMTAWKIGQGVGADTPPLARTPKVPTVSTGKLKTPGLEHVVLPKKHVAPTPIQPELVPVGGKEPRWF